MAKMGALRHRLTAGGRALGRDTGSLIAAAAPLLALYAAALLLPPELAKRLAPEGPARLGNLLGALALTPLFTALAAPTLAAAWRKRTYPLGEAVRAAGGKILRALATGVCAWALALALDLVTGLVSSAAGVVGTLTNWIPGVGQAIGLLTGALVWLALLAQAFVGHVILVYGMAALTVDQRWALPQAKRALAILWGGRTDALPELGLLFVVWVMVRGLMALIAALSSGPAAGILAALMETGLTALSTAAVMAIYLRERDRQDGWTL